MKISLRSLHLWFVLLLITIQVAFGEGSKQLTPGQSTSALTDPNNDKVGYLAHDANLASATGVAVSSLSFLKPAGFSRNGATYSREHRLYIRVRTGETLYYGVHRTTHEQGTGNQAALTITVRRTNPANNTDDAAYSVSSTLNNNMLSTRGMLLVANQNGVIDNATEALNGPNRGSIGGKAAVTTGYTPLVITNNTGTDYDYYVEFTQVGESNMSDEQRFSVYDLWDFTVIENATGNEKPGRMRSKLWAFSAVGTTNLFSRNFNMFPLVPAEDQAGKFFVKKVELAGIAPQNYFRFVTNSAGTTVGTTVEEKRKSQTTQSDYPEFFSFVNNPDETIWPSATTPTFNVAINSTCNISTGGGKSIFNLTTSDRSTFIALINLNGTAGYQAGTADVLLEQTGAKGSRTLEWNGLNGLGQVVANNTSINYSFRNGCGPVNFPMWDAEVNNGFRVEDVRPVASTNYNSVLFWDDRNLSTTTFPAPQFELFGVAPASTNTAGVHNWGSFTTTAANYNAGDLKTINTWTYGHINTQNQTTTYSYDCSADVAVTNTVSAGPYTIGKALTYTVTVTNNGPIPATNVSVTDKLDPTKFSEITASDAAYTNSSGVWTVGSLAVGASRTLTISAKPLEIGTFRTTASQTHTEVDNNTANNSAFVDINVVPSADVEVKNTVPQTVYNNGDVFNYTVTAKNLGPNNATGVIITDKLPKGLKLQNLPAAYDSASGAWSVGALALNETKTLILQAKAVVIGTYTTTATLGSRTNNELDNNSSNNVSSNTITVNPAADIAVTNVVSNATTNQNGTITYTITATNNGPNNATNVVVRGLIPAGVSFTNYSASSGTAATTNSEAVWNVGTILPNSSQKLIIAATPTATGQFTFTATQAHSEPDNNTANDNASQTINVQPTADVQVTNVIQSPKATYANGDVVIYLVTVTNNGPSTATNIVVDDKLPTSLTYNGHTASTGDATYDPATGRWTVGTLTNSTSATLTLTGTINQSAVITTTATQSHTEYDNINGNNSASNSIQSGTGTITADINIQTSATGTDFYTGTPVTFTVRATNQGPDAATNVAINAPLPEGFDFISANPKVGSYNESTKTWTIPNLANGSFTELTLIGTPKADNTVSGDKNYRFTATRTGTLDQTDNDPSDNSHFTDITVKKRADISTSITVTGANSDGNFYRGITEATFVITVRNNGPDVINNLIGRDTQTGTFSFTAIPVASGGTSYSTTTGIWDVGTLAPNEFRTLTVKGIPNKTGRLNLGGTVVTNPSYSYPYDNIPENNAAIALLNVVPVVDVAVTNTVSSAIFNNGETVTFTVKVQNNGADAATNVVIVDKLPDGLDLINVVTSSGTYDQASGEWTLGTSLLPGEGNAQTMTITVKPQAATTYATTASVKKLTAQYDSNPTNDSQTAETKGNLAADIALSSSIAPGPYYVGGQYLATITATNNGPDAATGVEIGSVLSPGLKFVPGSGTPAPGTSFDPSTGRWIINNLGVNESKNLTYLIEPTSSGNLTNSGYKLAGNQYDPNGGSGTSGNNSTNILLSVTDRKATYQLILSGRHYFYFTTGQSIAVASDQDGIIQTATFVSGTKDNIAIASLPPGVRLQPNGKLEVTHQYELVPGTYKLLLETIDAGGGVSRNEITYVISGDWDGDGIADDIDLDDNNDGVITEPGATNPTGDDDNDGVYNYLDRDFVHRIYGAFRDQNGDDIHDAFDLDLDGLIRGFDVDIDGDGITNVIEAYGGIVPQGINYDLSTGTFTGPVNEFGIPLAILKSGTNNQSNLPTLDSDNDSRRDYEDIDADNDGILDVTEAQTTNNYINKSFMDVDRDGLDDRYDITCGCGSNGVSIIPVNTDTQDKPDYLDLDSDNDLSADHIEAYDDNLDGTVIDDLKQRALNFESINNNIGYYTTADDNRNNIPNWLEMNNTSQYPQFLTYVAPPATFYFDTNRDGLVDLFDPSAGGRRSSLQTNSATNEYVFRSANNIVVLPVTLINFTATSTSDGIEVKWSTALEKDNAYFVVERSQDSRLFQAIGEVKGNGTTDLLNQYSLLDKQAPLGVIYYRLKQVDVDGKYTYSRIIAVPQNNRNPNAIIVKVYPNPASEITHLDLTALPEQEYAITLISLTGRTIKQTFVKGGNLVQLDISDLATGKYIIHIRGANYLQHLNFLKN